MNDVYPAIQLGISIIGIALMALVSYGGRKYWQGKVDTHNANIEKQMDAQFESTKQLCKKHQDELQELIVSDAEQKVQLKEHERRIFIIETKDN